MATLLGTGTTTLATYIPDLTDTANIQTALKQLYYGTTAGTLSTTTGIYGALYTLYSGNPTLAGNVTITGDLTVNGDTTTINVSNLLVEDKEIVIGNVASPTNTTANGGGIRLEASADGLSDKTILWDSTNSNWTTSENWNLATGKTLKIANVAIASGTGAALVLGANASTSLALGNTSGTTTINGTIAVNNPNRTMAHLMGYTSTATAAGTTTLTNTSSYYQQFTGSTTQTVVLPVTSTLITGWTYHIVNNSTGNLTVNSSGGNLVITVIPGTTAMATCVGTTLTTAADWESGLTDFATYTGTGNVVLGTQPTLTSPTISSIVNTGTLTVPTSGGTLATTALAGGGTNASLTASNGGIVYSTASALAILSGTATAGKMLRSGVSTAPTWSTATFPDTATSTGTILRANGTNWATSTSTFADTYTANSLLYASSANTVSGLALGTANQVLTVNSGGTAVTWATPTVGLSYVGSYLTTASPTTAAIVLATANNSSGGSATTGSITLATGVASAGGAPATTGSIFVDVGLASTGTPLVNGSINIGTQNTTAYGRPASITIGQSGVTTILPADTVILKTASFSVGAGEKNFNVTGTTPVSVTLPTATAGRTINIVNKAAQPISSSSTNVYPRNNNTLGTAICAGTAGSWATLVADGTNWYIMAGG
jgi:hypothetical protein